jgi:Flp pilus assembly protein TadD
MSALQTLGRLEEAVAPCEQALAINPGDAAIHNNLGLALEGAGRRREAAQHYEEALRLRPDLEQARQNLARVR